MTYASEALKTRSEKITLITIESVERVKLFTVNGLNWTRSMDYFVVGVKEDGASISSWSYSPTTKVLTIVGGADPKTRSISVTYRHFYSNAPIILPYDLSNGEPLEWEARVLSIGSIGQQLDSENTGIVLESSSSVDLENTDGFFDSFFDTHIWENQAIKFYSWFPNIPITEKVQLFEGVIESKSFTDKRISFRVKDFVYKLKNQANLGTFTLSDGSVLPSLLYTPKRRIYGQVDGLQCVSLDAILTGYNLTGTVTFTSASLIVTGTGTIFLKECSPSDELFVTDSSGVTYKYGIQSVDSDTQITLGKVSDNSFSLVTVKIKPQISPYYKNRTWSVAGHKLRAAQATIALVQSSNTFLVDTVQDFYEGDEVVINGIQSTVRRVSGDKIVTSTNILPTPVALDVIEKRPIKRVFANKTEYFFERDYTETNTTEAKIIFNNDAEFNAAEQRVTEGTLKFTNGSMLVEHTSNLRSVIKSRDWIRSSNASRTQWYEVLDVDDAYVYIREPISYAGGPYTELAFYKNITPIDESSLVAVNCLGMEYAGAWMRTASDVVRHLVLNDAIFPSVNETSFAEAKGQSDHTISLFIPETLGQASPLVRDVITKINSSIFGSLYGDSSQLISFSVLNSTKPELSEAIKDDDILSFSVETTQKIANKVIVKYRPYVDINSEQSALLDYSYESAFVDDYIGIKSTIERTAYLYNESSAIIMAQRLALFNSLSSSSVKINAKLNLAQTLVNDKIYLSLDRLYNRYGGQDKRKLGTVTGVKKNGYGVEISVNDLGNIYNRVPSFAPNTILDYATSSPDDKIKWGYILDNDTETADAINEEGLGNYIIG